MKEYQHLIGKIIIAIAIIVAAIIIAGAIEGAGANIQSGLWKLRDALREFKFVLVKEDEVPTVPKRCQELRQIKIQYAKTAVFCRFCHLKA